LYPAEKDFKTFLSYLSEYRDRYNFHLYAYALMKNHFHLLLEVGKIPLSKIMQHLLYRYTRYFNRRYEMTGHLFQGRYRAILCDKDSYLLELVRYIHLNPVRAKVVRDPEKYLWTGHLGYLGKMKDSLLEEDFLLGQFGEYKSLARRKYRQFVLERLDGRHEDKYYEVKDQRYLGEDSFIDCIKSKKEEAENAVFDIPIEVIAQEVSKAAGITQEILYSSTRNREGAWGRSLVAYLARVLSRNKVKDTAWHFGRSPMVISQGIIRIEREMGKDKGLYELTEKLKRELIKKAKRKYFITIA
jgi:putative transposase